MIIGLRNLNLLFGQVLHSMEEIRDQIDERSAHDKCLLVQAAVTSRRPLEVTEALKKYSLSSSVYYR